MMMMMGWIENLTFIFSGIYIPIYTTYLRKPQQGQTSALVLVQEVIAYWRIEI
jgi:hypothetical protein